MEGTLKLVGSTSNDIYLMRYPNSLLEFCDYDLSYFAKTSIELCDEAFKSGNLDPDKVSALRKDITPAHCYIEHNIRTIYEHIVEDCWIDSICRRDNIGTNALWNRFMRCKTPFEKTIFARLCEFRYNHAINEWVNIVRVQDYAKEKIKFIFMQDIKSISDAATRRNYFDLTFSVTAKELGCRIEDLGVTKVFSVGRIPTAPFVFPNTSKEIMRNVLSEFDYSDDYSDIGDYGSISDQIAMDAFAQMKDGLNPDTPTYTLTKGKMDSYTERIYMPCGLKAAVDLEIDILIESGSWLSKCKRCGRFFLRNNEHSEEYCSRVNPGGKTCLEIYEEEHPRPKMTEELEQKCSDVVNEVYKRVDKSMNVKEYENWHSYMEAMKEKVKSGEITPEELDNFLDYSLEVDITKSNPIVEIPKPETEEKNAAPTVPAEIVSDGQRERVVRPFVPERISRSELEKQQPPPPINEPEVSEGFFTSPSFQRQKGERPQISHIIRNGESLGDNGYKSPDPAGFRPFGQPAQEVSREIPANIVLPDFKNDSNRPKTLSELKAKGKGERDPFDDLKRLEEKLDEERRLRLELEARMGRLAASDEDEIIQRKPKRKQSSLQNDVYDEIEAVRKRTKRKVKAQEIEEAENVLEKAEFEPFIIDTDEQAAYMEDTDPADETSKVSEEYESSFDAVYESKTENLRGEKTKENNEEPVPKQRPKVIRKNAAAISAYGKIAGTALTSAQSEMNIVSEPEESGIAEDIQPMPDPEPFKDIGSIFDVLEQSGQDTSQQSRPRPPHQGNTVENKSELEAERPTETPEKITAQNAPEGFWIEDRNLFPDDDKSAAESDVSKDKRHSKTNKTRRLYDVIMKDADDNPNFRRR